MPAYDFKDVETGEVLALSLMMSEAPGFDEDFVWEGRVLRRAWIPENIRVGVSVSENFDQVVGYAMSDHHPSIDACGIKRNEYGEPVFTSRDEIKRFNIDSQRQHEKDPTIPAYGFDGKKE